MNIKEQVISLQNEIESLKKDTIRLKEMQEKIIIVKKQNKVLLHSIAIMMIALILLLIFTLYIF